MEELCRAPPWRLLVQPSALQSSSMEVARAALRDTPAELCALTKLLTASLKPTEADCQSSNTTSAGRSVERKEVKVKLNGDANQRIDFIWRRALRVSQTDGELSEQSCAEAIDCKLETDGGRPVRAAIPPLRAAERKEVKAKLNGDANQRIDFIWRRALRVSQTDGELSEQSCAELHRKEVKAKLNGDANQRIDFIWRRALRVSQTDGELSEQSCAELHRKEVKAKLNGDANQRIDFIWRRALRVSKTDGELSEQSCAEALRGYRGGLYEQPPWRSSAELRAERATSMEELCRAPPWS
ncbi:hypothetical protein Bbelb_259360 [Branchiostoma belcheri]|nr:hypothetical protein Bbelb_259360 [Branchiostoma belcheri]